MYIYASSSHNFTPAAFGYKGAGEKFNYCNYELGIVFAVQNLSDFGTSNFPIPYNAPILTFTAHDKPWIVADSEYEK
jgi:hypothetical protein